MKYIDADLLRKEIERRREANKRQYHSSTGGMSWQRMCGEEDCLVELLAFLDSLQQEQPTNTGNLCSELTDFLVRNDVPEEKAKFLANRISDEYGSKKYLEGLCDGIKQEQQEVKLKN